MLLTLLQATWAPQSIAINASFAARPFKWYDMTGANMCFTCFTREANDSENLHKRNDEALPSSEGLIVEA